MGSTGRFLILLSPSSSLLLHRSPSLIRLPGRRHHHRLLPLHHDCLVPQPRSLRHIIHTNSSPLLTVIPSHRRRRHHHHLHTQSAFSNYAESFSPAPPQHLPRHPWPEFSFLLQNLSAAGYFNSDLYFNPDEFASAFQPPEEFLRAASACLAFARDKANSLGMLSRTEIEVLVQSGMPFLFKNGEESARRMRVFLGSGGSNVSDADKADMVDLMKFVLSYASNVIAYTETNNLYNGEFVESSVRNLLGELAKLSVGPLPSNRSASVQTQFSQKRGQTRSFGKNIEMKRGDWICPRCNFMNFARNMKCLECEEARPKRQLTGGEWECPQCAFYNYARNVVCLRCDCKRPGDISLGGTNSQTGLAYNNASLTNKVDLDARLAANEEKAQRWFSKVSQLDGISDMSSAIADEDFPEIMPLRKGVNRFVVSTRKTPLERRLANAQYQRNMSNDGNSKDNTLLTGDANKALDPEVGQSLDEILGCSSAASRSNNNTRDTEQKARADSALPTSGSTSQCGPLRGNMSDYVPFVPLPADMFARKPENLKMEDSKKNISQDIASNAGEQTSAVSGSEHSDPSNEQSENSDKEDKQAQKSERWFKKVAELHGVTDLASVSDNDFPEIMPMRKGDNRFVVNRRKDHYLTSPTYKKRRNMEQANDNNYVPFVPFPPNYFAERDNQPDRADSSPKDDEISAAVTPEKYPEKSCGMAVRDGLQQMENQQAESWNSKPSGENLNQTSSNAAFGGQAFGNSTQNFFPSQININDGGSRGDPGIETKKETTNSTGSSCQPSAEHNIQNSWNGKSLEGSAVKEPDLLDMSEEAKAERWFRRVAQIKDISELSQIPDEDFPSIMPMRKGVNRFVVSKRKTPLERRLTSQKYRRNLTVESSDPVNKEGDNN
ncbi:hypothetical protein SLE2022_131090 [Rubroshorea leprosula]